MGFVNDIMRPFNNFVGEALGPASDLLNGPAAQPARYTPMTQAEIDRMREIEAQLLATQVPEGSMPQDQQIQSLFRDRLIKFLGTDSGTGKFSPELLADATSFVDDTFTTPATAQLKQFQDDFTNQQRARAVAMGRGSDDIAAQQAISGEMGRQISNLQAERGSRIGQAAQGFRDFQTTNDLNQLQTGLTSSSYFNQLGQQAFANRLNLLNARTGLANFYQAQRAPGAVVPGSGGLFQTATAGAGLAGLAGYGPFAQQQGGSANTVYSGGAQGSGRIGNFFKSYLTSGASSIGGGSGGGNYNLGNYANQLG